MTRAISLSRSFGAVATDGNAGVVRAVEDVFPLALRQRCQKHKMNNLLGKGPKEAAEEFKKATYKAFRAETYDEVSGAPRT